VSGLAGAIAGATAVWSFRALTKGSSRIHEDLLRPFAAVTMVIAAGALCLPVAAGSLRAGVISVVPLLTFLVAFIPWNVFAFRYAGRGDLLTRWRVLTVGSLVAVLLIVYSSVAAGVFRPTQESYSSVLLAASTLLLVLVAITFVSSGLALTATYRHDTVPVTSGVAVVFPIAILVVGIQVVSLSTVLTRDLLASLHFLAAAAAFPVAIARYDVPTTRPGTPRLGERTVIKDLNEAVLVSDTEGVIVRSNRQAERLFGADLDGQDVEDVVGADNGTLREVSTLECWTDQGYKRLDPRVSTVRPGHGRTVGETVTLIDVTGREMLRQRVQVLNRILRHNIRNDIDVIRSHAEFALRHGNKSQKPTRADESIERILEVTDQVTRLSADARRVERLTRNSSADQSVVDVPQLVTEVVETVTRDRPDVSVTVQVPTVELSINRELFRFALRNLVDNAVEHNDNPSPSVEVRGIKWESGIRLLISDNGPGIPDAEWQVIEAGREEVYDHATSLGLWATKWTVQTIGGELSRRDTESGATVVIDLPERSPIDNAEF
jgi:signal transduction histidine kinase